MLAKSIWNYVLNAREGMCEKCGHRNSKCPTYATDKFSDHSIPRPVFIYTTIFTIFDRNNFVVKVHDISDLRRDIGTEAFKAIITRQGLAF